MLNLSEFGAIAKNIEELNDLEIRVGFTGPNGSISYADGITVSNVAMYQEYGTKHIPKRSFIRSSMLQQESKVAKIMEDAVQDIVMNDKSPIDAASDIGKKVSKIIYDKADSAPSWAIPNAQSTIDKKGSMKQLEDSKKMINAIGWAVYKGSSIQKYGLAKG